MNAYGNYAKKRNTIAHNTTLSNVQTIEQIKEERTYYRREKDAFGNVTRVPYTAMVPRPVEVVTPGWRFLYFIIDSIFLQIILAFVAFILRVGLLSDQFITQEDVRMYNLLSPSLGLFVSFGYYTITEAKFGGTPAKLIFGYRVIDQYARPVTMSQTALRTLIRWIPFEAFSCLGDRGWHDRWTKTYVVKKEEQFTLQNLLGQASNREDILD